MSLYTKAMVEELYAPLVAIHSGLMGSKEAISTALLCETLLSMLPNMSLKDKPYQLLKHYHVTPIESGVIGRTNRICLKDLA